jgi:hypothetical protein
MSCKTTSSVQENCRQISSSLPRRGCFLFFPVTVSQAVPDAAKTPAANNHEGNEVPLSRLGRCRRSPGCGESGDPALLLIRSRRPSSARYVQSRCGDRSSGTSSCDVGRSFAASRSSAASLVGRPNTKGNGTSVVLRFRGWTGSVC